MLLPPGATLAGADDVVEIQLWGNQNLAFLRRFRPYAPGVPSHDTPGAVVRVLDPGLFKGCFTSWVAGLLADAPDLVAVDGTTARRTHARRQGREPLDLLAARASRQRLVLGQEAVAGKGDEITAIPLGAGAPTGCSASGPQPPRPTRSSWSAARWPARSSPSMPSGPRARSPTPSAGRAATISWRSLLALKANRPATSKDVAAFFADPPPGALDTFETVDGAHGRSEVRRRAVGHDVGWLFSDRRYPDEVAFPGLALIGMVEAAVERGGKTERKRRY